MEKYGQSKNSGQNLNFRLYPEFISVNFIILRTCVHRKAVLIFDHNFIEEGKTKKRKHTDVPQGRFLRSYGEIFNAAIDKICRKDVRLIL